jgi:TrmH family RNA methyltransferase
LKSWIDVNENKIKNLDYEVQEASIDDLKKISLLTTPNQVLAIIEIPQQKKVTNWNFLLSELTLVLDTIQDPGNLGTIIRIADWFGIRNIIASPETVDFYNPKVVQSAMGSLKRVNFYTENLDSFFKSIPEIPIYGALLSGTNLYEEKLSHNGIIVIGNESKGISNELQKYVNQTIMIPYFNFEHAESLNVSVATGIICAEFRRQQSMT